MNKKTKLQLTILLLMASLVTGGASAILLSGIPYDVLYALHKITSVLAVIFFIIYLRSAPEPKVTKNTAITA